MSDVPAWTDKASVLIAGLALAASVPSLFIAWAAYRLAQRQDRRLAPNLSLSLTNHGYTAMTDPPGRAYWFDLSVSNLSAADNAVATLDLELAYRRDDVELTARIPMAPAAEAPLTAPFRVAAHDTVAGRGRFLVPERYLGDGAILHGVALLAADTHGRLVRTTAGLVREAPL